MKTCKICGEIMDNWIIIDNKKRNIKNRKYCLKCSPWGSHNTKQLHKKQPAQPSHYEDNEKFCNMCKKTLPISDFDKKHGKIYLRTYCKSCYSKIVMENQKRKKIDAVNYNGGHCLKCGYDKNYGSLVFHHKNKKDCDWKKLRSMSWENIIEEINKCDLLCQNCHTELHNPQAFLK